MYGPLPAKMCRNVLLCVDVDIKPSQKAGVCVCWLVKYYYEGEGDDFGPV